MTEISRLVSGRGVVKVLTSAAVLLAAAPLAALAADPVVWTVKAAPTAAMITGGPWTLEQSGAANGLKSSGYCDANGNQMRNEFLLVDPGVPATERMQPYYFPVIAGVGKDLQGYFDYRPKDTDEAVVAAVSHDAGYTWTFQQEVLELRTTCPTQQNKEPDGEKAEANAFNIANNSDNGDDDGQGHQFVIKLAGHTYLYTLIRAAGHIDNDQLVIHDLSPAPGLPLNGTPALTDAPTDTSPASSYSLHTIGLLNPDGILGIVPAKSPLTIIYEQKILNGDITAPTALPVGQQCNTAWAPFYAGNSKGTGVNDDITYLRLATTTDGIHFQDLGALQGLNDPTDVTVTGTRWLATAGTIMRLEGGRYGLLFSGGNCMDGDSDAFHYIGYAETSDPHLIQWTVVNGLNNPIVSVAPETHNADASGLPVFGGGGTPVTVPAREAVVGNTMGFFAGRVYAPSATLLEDQDITVVFAGYHTPKPKNGLGDYRTIGRVTLHSSEPLGTVGNPGGDGN